MRLTFLWLPGVVTRDCAPLACYLLVGAKLALVSKSLASPTSSVSSIPVGRDPVFVVRTVEAYYSSRAEDGSECVEGATVDLDCLVPSPSSQRFHFLHVMAFISEEFEDRFVVVTGRYPSYYRGEF